MVDWNAIDTVLLDMDGTLLDLHFDSHFWLEHLPQRYVELHKLDAHHADTLRSRIIGEQGTLNWYSLAYWSRELGVDVVALKREVQHLIGLRGDALDFLKWLKKAHPRVVLATNADRESLALKLPLTGLEGYLDAIVSSADVGVAKEAPEFWFALQDIEPFEPARTLFIDDNPAVLESAREYGIRYLLGIKQPDSQRPERELENFIALERFATLLPQDMPSAARR
ncbi:MULTISPECIES: GMP/IMP nucleotidase [Chromohalobacter]|uniref:GMP/IMP nucleotidase n=5 Tax=Chromohalobacter TaxID=42054 RepID=A0A285VFU7_9GAMM|nr:MULTISPECIES: GMP/IMP nucleotidase [Chromohalobacter]MCK0751752.1 GMP/IMP nucleotidase [Chromohalobacter japonicus]MCK0765418.1 GMP/IMP nucleotidase [Chromohalobacter beijerinckii]MCK0767581.1 GMP/IMP nucleotidase [Chromohalobacter canadensis]MCK2045305.1 GMP/IMP nucleotidase [Chromohalobacter moromii]MCT8505028.1 GMP/IMP nucleotidase [Chromohalobacter moromii]